MEEYKVNLVSQRRSPVVAALRLYDDSDECRLELLYDGQSYAATGDDFFESFSAIREHLEPLGFLPRCYGAHLRAFPSGMSRSMGGGAQVYRLTLGVQAQTKDLIHMFESDDEVQPATVREQRAFFEQWLASLGK